MSTLGRRLAFDVTCNCPESGTSGSCPFHDSSTMRFTVEPQPGRWDTKLGRIVTELEDAAYERGRAEATAAAEQRLRERIEAHIDATTIAGKVEFRLSHSEWRVPVQAVWQWLSALLVTLSSASPRQGEEDEVEPCNIEPAFSQHEYAVDYCEAHDRPADQCAPSPTSPRQGEPVDVERLARAIDVAWRREGSDHHLFGPGLADEGRKLAALIAAEWTDV